jgi:ornithine cyclodeaminase/alanine dehydrogenase-like protein (mu-crystallin family)
MEEKRWGPTRLISKEQVQRCVDMSDAITVVEQVLRGHAKGRVAMPAKVTMDLAEFGLKAWNTAMPAYIEPLSASGFKWVGGFADNRERHGLPFLIATILVQDVQTGYPLAVMEGTHITNLRTGALNALAVRHYAHVDAHSLALIGTGVQARFALDGILREINLREVRGYDLQPEAARRFADEVERSHGIHVRVCSNAEEAVRGAQIVITATPSIVPIVRREWMGPGVTAISVGSQGQEFDDEAVLGADKLICDSWEQCMHLGELREFAESGRLSRDDVFAEICETVDGRKPGRERDDEYILVVPIGLGSLDIGLARFVYDRVVAQEETATFRFFES